MTMNVVLVVFDTLRKDAVGSYGQTPPWEMAPIATPNLDAFASESIRLTNAYPESLPTLCARRAIYTGQRTYPFHNGDFRGLKGDFVGIAPGWGPIPNEQHTLSEILQNAGYRTALISDLYHQFKPSKNFWRGFDQWTFIRGQETDTSRSGPGPTQAELDAFIPRRFQELRKASRGVARLPGNLDAFSTACLLNMRDRVREELWFNAQVFQEAARWLEQNRDAERFFLTVESFDPHEPWFVPEHYRRAYDASDGPEQVVSPYAEVPELEPELLTRTRANYAGLVTMCDRWFGHLMETLRVLGMLENTLVVVTSDHGHSIWERRGYIGKRGYPSDPEVVDIPTFVRRPAGAGAGTTVDAWVQHHDIAPTILDALELAPPEPVDGRSFWGTLVDGAPSARDHVVIGWGTAMTVVTERWWFNAKVDGTGPLLYDRSRPDGFDRSVADDERAVCRELFALGRAEARGEFPDFLLELAKGAADAPGCSPFAAG